MFDNMVRMPSCVQLTDKVSKSLIAVYAAELSIDDPNRYPIPSRTRPSCDFPDFRASAPQRDEFAGALH